MYKLGSIAETIWHLGLTQCISERNSSTLRCSHGAHHIARPLVEVHSNAQQDPQRHPAETCTRPPARVSLPRGPWMCCRLKGSSPGSSSEALRIFSPNIMRPWKTSPRRGKRADCGSHTEVKPGISDALCLLVLGPQLPKLAMVELYQAGSDFSGLLGNVRATATIPDHGCVFETRHQNGAPTPSTGSPAALVPGVSQTSSRDKCNGGLLGCASLFAGLRNNFSA